MTRSQFFGELLFDPEIEKTARKLYRDTRDRKVESSTRMEQNHNAPGNHGNEEDEILVVDGRNGQPPQMTLRDYAMPTLEGLNAHMIRPTINANNFELKLSLIQFVQQNVQFSGLGHEDPNEHLVKFMEIANTLKVNGVTADTIHIMLFPFSLAGRAKEWWNDHGKVNVHTWEQVVQKFMARYFPASKSIKLKNEILCFNQDEDEMVGEAWERFQGLIRKCPNHGLQRYYLVQTFHNGLTPSTKTMLDVSAGGSFDKKTPEEAYDMLEELSANHHQSQTRGPTRRVAGVHELDAQTKMEAQIASLTIQLEQAKNVLAGQGSQGVNPVFSVCTNCGGGHDAVYCQGGTTEQAQFASNFNRQQNGMYSNTYNPSWKHHPNFSWSNNQNAVRPPPPPPGFQNQSQFQKPPESRLEILERMLNEERERTKNIEASQKNIERQLGQLAEALNSRGAGSLPSNTEKNPREHAHAVTLRNGRNLAESGDKKSQETGEELPIEQEVTITKTSGPSSMPIPLPFPQKTAEEKVRWSVL